MLKKILIIAAATIAVIVIAFVAVVAMQPADFKIERTAGMSAPPAEVFAQVNDFHNWDAWSPWAKLDPAAKNTFEGSPEGEGAIFRWSGNEDVGEGKMTILESRPSELVKIKLEFIRPFENTATAQFAFQPEGDQTKVTWSMFGKNGFLAKAFCLFMDMDKTVGKDFEKGLAAMKSVVEAEPKGTEEPSATSAARESE
ncbi:MAG: SRPBCC family protein [Planctomycetia bacterium]|nr:SRPBCC family protein [Planctomycetia bacterium]